ncbi:MAG: hypothetical protein A2W03_05780 [Candidatus Aminicenantes bacterium RBG_16_63_16]|nr:MAG: hypothetical protein A2W03_05780 [Candidatus Aminicenantes bacterium RBG_16_63_16]
MKGQKQSKLIVAAIIIFLAAIGSAIAQNIVKNGGFENPPVATPNGAPYFSPGSRWNSFPNSAAFNNDLGWTVEWRSDLRDWLIDFFNVTHGLPVPPPQLELQENGVYSANSIADSGTQWAELDSDWSGPFAPETAPNPPHRNGVPGTETEVTSISIYQLLNTQPGTYVLSFVLGGRPGAGNMHLGQMQNRVKVHWGGQEVLFWGLPYATASDPGVGNAILWTKYTSVLQATGPDTELRFTDYGYADSFGTFIDSVSVVRIEDGCTKTQGYWKTHSIYGPASRVDPTWALVGPLGADEPFLGSGLTWYQVLTTEPKGNAYFILAHQYIAANLNLLAGASTYKNISHADFVNAMAEAQTLLSVSPSSVRKQDRQPYVDIAFFLTKYNEGIIGPGHCFDEGAESTAIPWIDESPETGGRDIR